MDDKRTGQQQPASEKWLDAFAKRIYSIKSVVAVLLKLLVDAYSSYSVSEILKEFIDPLNPNDKFMTPLDSGSWYQGMRGIVYDLLFCVYAPVGDGSRKEVVYLNIEVQRAFPGVLALLGRVRTYLVRLVDDVQCGRLRRKEPEAGEATDSDQTLGGDGETARAETIEAMVTVSADTEEVVRAVELVSTAKEPEAEQESDGGDAEPETIHDEVEKGGTRCISIWVMATPPKSLAGGNVRIPWMPDRIEGTTWKAWNKLDKRGAPSMEAYIVCSGAPQDPASDGEWKLAGNMVYALMDDPLVESASRRRKILGEGFQLEEVDEVLEASAVYRTYAQQVFDEGEAKGEAKGEIKGKLTILRTVLEAYNVTPQQALANAKIPEREWSWYLARLATDGTGDGALE